MRILDLKTEHKRTRDLFQQTWTWLPISLATAIQLHLHIKNRHIPPSSVMLFNLPFSLFERASEELSAQYISFLLDYSLTEDTFPLDITHLFSLVKCKWLMAGGKKQD